MANNSHPSVEIIPDMGIVLSDGTRLSARVWMPEGALGAPLPAVLEYLPYRKSDGTAARDYPMHLHYARHGYVSVRVDRRGCGDSEGLFDDEYSEQELSDGEEIIAWIADQDWCDGNVGIQGISWGGFNGLQIAARQPEALKAVISIGTTVDRFADDIHYKGGIQLSENIGWAATVMSWFSMPPDAEIVGADWRKIWLERLEAMPFLARDWMEHKTRDAYWKHGSVCEDFGAIKAPVLAMGGMLDGYRNAMAALVENLDAPVFGVAGPWTHKYPHISTVEPRIDFLNLAVRWWDRWLKGVENGADNDPAYRAYVMDNVPPETSVTERPGRWVSEAAWPSENVTAQVLAFGDGSLGRAGAFETVLASDLACGQQCGEFFPFGFGAGELPDEQSPDDALSAVFDSAPVGEDWDILGAPKVALRLSCDAARGQVVVRLCDVAPDGTSALISLGMLNLRHRDGFGAAVDLTPGEVFDVSVELDQAAYRLPKGHRLRVSVSTSYWPFCWPEGRAFALTLLGGSLSCPVRAAGLADGPAFDPPIAVEERPEKQLDIPREGKTLEVDGDKLVLTIFGDQGRSEALETGLITSSARTETWSIDRSDPASACCKIVWERGLERNLPKGRMAVRTTHVSEMWGLADHFKVRQSLTAWEGDEQVFDRVYECEVAR